MNIMGLTKIDLYTDEQVEIAAMAKVIGHPARVAILQHLLKVETCICGDIVDEIGLAQPTISQHLREMKNIGLIQGNIEGTKVCYCIDSVVFAKIKTLFNKIFDHSSMECCG